MALDVPDTAAAEGFYTRAWKLRVAARGDGAVCLRGAGPGHHLLALHEGSPCAAIRSLTLRARRHEALDAIARARDARRRADA